MIAIILIVFMEKDKPQGVLEFPLTEHTARLIINDLARNHTDRIAWSWHVKQRMLERGVTSQQILTLLKSRRSVFKEGPYEDLNGDWKFNLKGLAAGQIIEVTIALKNYQKSPLSVVVTVWVV